MTVLPGPTGAEVALAELEAEVRRLRGLLLPYENYLGMKLWRGLNEEVVAEEDIQRIAALLREGST